MKSSDNPIQFPALVQEFFCRRLREQRDTSPETIASYRDTFRLLITYAARTKKKDIAKLCLEDLNASLILGFLDHLERDRGNSARTRNTRLTAIRSFTRYASFRSPAYLETYQQIQAIPTKRFDRPLIGFLSREEMQAIIDAPDRSTASGYRDHVMFSMFYNTGARVSEIANLKTKDIILGSHSMVSLHGKGRKERSVPLWKETSSHLKKWCSRTQREPASPLFPNRVGGFLTRSGIEHRLRVAVRQASRSCSSLKDKTVTPHTIRHTTAMHLLQAGIDITVIALWLGHEKVTTTHMYLEADLALKEKALSKLESPAGKTMRYRATGGILAFLESL